MTVFLVPLGAALGWALYVGCDQTITTHDPSAMIHQALTSFSFSLLAPLVPLNYLFDLTSTLVTVWLISHAIRSFRYKLYSLVATDFAICIILMANLFFLMGSIKPSHEIDVLPYFQFMSEIFQMGIKPDCSSFNFLTQKALLSFTILIPTALYLATSLVFLAMYEAYRINRFMLSYLLEKSVEDEKKSFFSVIGIAIGLIGVTAKFLVELARLITINAA